MEDDRLKLLLITPFYPSHGGGVEIVAYKIARELCQKGMSVTWCASSFDKLPEAVPNLEISPYSASNIVETKLHLPFPLPGINALRQIYKAICAANVVHLHDYLYAPNIFAWLVAKKKHKPIIITQHIGLVPYQNPLFRHLLQLLNKTVGNFILSRTQQTIFISDQVKHYFESMPTRQDRNWKLIPNGVDSSMFKPNPDTAPSYILFVGRFVEKKGLLFLRALASQLQNYNWVFVGRGPINPGDWNLPNIKVVDLVDQSELVALYQSAHLLVLPSVGEGFPLVIQEAMACGTPVLTTQETANGSVAAKSLVHCLPVDPTNAAEEWTKKILDIIGSAKKPNELSGFAHSHWSWATVGEHYLKLAQEIQSTPAE